MKKYIILFAITLLFSCSSDNDSSSDESQNQSTGQGGSLASFTIVNDYLYTVDDSSLNIFSLVNNEQPTKVNDIPIGFRIETIFNYKEFLYMGSTTGMYIYSLENPEAPVYKSEVQHFTACDPVIANDTHAFVTLHSESICGNDINILEVYDVTNVLQPFLVSSRNLSSPKGMGLYGEFLFVCDDDIKIFDVSNPNEMVLVSSIDKYAFDVIIRDNLLIVIGENGLYQYALDTSNIENIQSLSSILF